MFIRSRFFWSILSSVILACFTCSLGQDVFIKGRVLDEKSEPITHAFVTLAKLKIGDSTDVNGNFEIRKGTYAGIASESVLFSDNACFQIQNRVLVVNASARLNQIRFRITNILGATIASFEERDLSPGRHEFNFSKIVGKPLAGGIYILNFSLNGKNYALKYLNSGSFFTMSNFAQSGTTFSKHLSKVQASLVDTLIVYKSDAVYNRMQVLTYFDTAVIFQASVKGPDTSLASLSFELDSTLAKSKAIGTPGCTLSVTDSKGISWTLSVPPSDWYSPVTITATPFRSAHSSDSLWNVSSGVMFGPDGFRFIEPATITVELPSSVTLDYSFYLINANGSKLSFADFAKSSTGVYKVKVNHFSGVGGGESSQIDAQCQAAKSYYQSVIEQTKTFLASPAGNAPVPPDISNLCRDTKSRGGSVTSEAIKNDYAEKFLSPEFDYISSLTSCLGKMQLCNSTQDNTEVEALQCKLLERLSTKALNLVKTYNGNEKKFVAVSFAVIGVARRIATLQCSGSTEEAITTAVTNYARTCRDYWKNELVKSHDLEAYYPAKEFHRRYLTGGGVDDGFQSQLAKAMSFSLTFKFSAKVGVAEDAVDLSGEGTFDVKMDAIDAPIAGSGTLNYLKGTIGSKCGTPGQACPSNLISTGFTTDAKVEYDPCQSPDEIKIISPFTASAIENWDMCKADCSRMEKSLTGTGSYTHSMCVMPFTGPPTAYWDSKTEIYTIPFTKVKAALLLDKEFASNFGVGVDVKVHVTLEHKPQ